MLMKRLPKEPPGWLYVWIVIILGVTLVAGVIGWFMLITSGWDMPDSLATILSTIAGGLVGALSMSGPTDRGES